MRIGTFQTAASMLALGLAAWVTPSHAQGPLYDSVRVNLPYTVTIGDTTLQPGEYYIRENDSAGKSYVLSIFSDNGSRKFETQTMTIPAYKVATPDDTTVILHHFGNDYYFDRIWIQGKNYGYEFPLPSSVKERERERMQPVTVAATYQATPAPVAQDGASAAPPPAAAEPAPPPPAPAPEVAQAQPEPAPAPAPVAEEPAPSPAPTPAMPQTASNWAATILAGMTFGAGGLLLRSKLGAARD